MDVPVLTAVISVSGALLGTIVGGCLTMYSNFFLNKRRERAEFKIGCRLIAGELEEIGVLLGILLKLKWSKPADLGLTMKTWEEHRHVLASCLSDEAWRDVRKAVRSVSLCQTLLAIGENDEMTDGDAKAVAGLAADITKALTSLQPYLEKTKTTTITSTPHLAGRPQTTRAG